MQGSKNCAQGFSEKMYAARLPPIIRISFTDSHVFSQGHAGGTVRNISRDLGAC